VQPFGAGLRRSRPAGVDGEPTRFRKAHWTPRPCLGMPSPWDIGRVAWPAPQPGHAPWGRSLLAPETLQAGLRRDPLAAQQPPWGLAAAARLP